jgi:hypothetical protein
MLRAVSPSLAVLVLFLCGTASGDEKKPPSAATPEEFVKLHIEASQKLKDVKDARKFAETMTPLLARSSRDNLAALLALMKDVDELLRALDRKFGADRGIKPYEDGFYGHFPYPIRSIDILEKKELEKGVLRLKVWRVEDRDGKEAHEIDYLVLVFEDSGWKERADPMNWPSNRLRLEETRKSPAGKEVRVQVTPEHNGPPPAEFEQARQKMAREAEVFRRFRKEVEDGKYKTRQEVYEAVAKELQPKPPG